MDEIFFREYCSTVALRKESVDRNICYHVIIAADRLVALRKESVDRNVQQIAQNLVGGSRSPQGERG